MFGQIKESKYENEKVIDQQSPIEEAKNKDTKKKQHNLIDNGDNIDGKLCKTIEEQYAVSKLTNDGSIMLNFKEWALDEKREHKLARTYQKYKSRHDDYKNRNQ